MPRLSGKRDLGALPLVRAGFWTLSRTNGVSSRSRTTAAIPRWPASLDA